MSNKIVPVVYRAIVDDVMNNIRSEFEEFGIGEQVLRDLQNRWELKIMNSHVAEFERPSSAVSQQQQQQQQHHHHQQQQAQQQLMQSAFLPPPQLGMPPPGRYDLPPPLAGPPPSAPGSYQRSTPSNGLSLNPSYGLADLSPSAHRIPQLDGPSNTSSHEDDSASSDGSVSPETKSVPLPSLKKANDDGIDDDDAVIGSDLDDSDDDENEENYDDDIEGGSKVQRVKNKWKCVLKDGMVHINGKDYLFNKCTGEFEW